MTDTTERRVAKVHEPTPGVYVLALHSDQPELEPTWLNDPTPGRTALDQIAEAHNEGRLNLDTGEPGGPNPYLDTAAMALALFHVSKARLALSSTEAHLQLRTVDAELFDVMELLRDVFIGFGVHD